MNRMRLAIPDDAEEILKIYSFYVENTCASFETKTPSKEVFSQRIRDISEVYPYVVYEVDGKIVGYAYAHRYAERAAYCYGVEVSVYVHESYHSKGVAQKLYDALFEIMAEQGLYNAYSGITVPNEKSHRFHEKYGFEYVGAIPHAGYKHGKWLDVEWMAKKIRPLDPAPGPIKAITELDPSLVEDILVKCCKAE